MPKSHPSDSDSWDELGALLVNVLELPHEERDDFLAEACKGYPERRAEVESLLKAYESAPGYLNSLAGGILPVPEDEKEARPDKPKADPYRLVGKSVTRYKVHEVLGGGGMGIVYLAEDTRLKRPVALKFLPPYLSDSKTAKQRFTNEAQAASTLDHPNVCTIYEVEETEAGQLYIAMAYYEGETLREKMADCPMPVDEAIDLAKQTANGLSGAHAQGIVHRDIKPGNIIVTKDGVVKILDFGLAKLAGGVQLTRTGTRLGTAAYMSPEQAQGLSVDHRTDIWALGAVLYEMVTGQRPFPGEYGPAVIYGILNIDPQPVTGLRTGLPMQFAHIINKALAKPVHERYQHMTEFIDDLEKLQERKTARSNIDLAMLNRRTEHEVLPFKAARARQKDEPTKILVVDDEPHLELLIRQKFRHQIKNNEWVFQFAEDGAEALEILQADDSIHLVLTDLNMPRMDGLTLLNKLSDLDHLLKTVVVSAYGDIRNIRTAMNRGAFDFVIKPIDFADLETTIKKTHRELLAYEKATEAQCQLVALQKELEVARRIQEAILPVCFPERDDVELYAFMTSAHDVGGTFYDCFPIGQHQIGFTIGDVSGRGVSAALFMAMSQTFLKGIALEGKAPGTCLTSMNRLFFNDGFPDLYVTVFYGVLDTKTGWLDYCNAGHPAPYIIQSDGSVRPMENAGDVPVWQMPDHDFTTYHSVLKPGDGMMLYTRGIIDAVDKHGHAFSTDRLVAKIRDIYDGAPAEIIRTVIRAVMRYAKEPHDDLTVMALKRI